MCKPILVSRGVILCALFVLLCGPGHNANASTSIARTWDEQILAAIRIDAPAPTIHARNLFDMSAAMYDAWAAYDPVAVGYLYRGKVTSTNLVADRNEAISYAAYRILSERYLLSKNAPITITALNSEMASLGYDINNTSTDTNTAAGLGNTVASNVSSYFINDGALQTRFYIDLPTNEGGYAPVNPPLAIGTSGTLATNPNFWQPLFITNAATQNGLPAPTTQVFVGSQWINVRPFALVRPAPAAIWFDPGPPPMLDGVGDQEYRNDAIDILFRSSVLTPSNGLTMDISPGAFGNNTLGKNDGTGHSVNPITGQTYPPNVVKLGDFARVLAEYWADGPSSETPPGHWNLLANNVTDNPSLVKQIGGAGPVVDDLEWDIKLYFALNGALHDAACAAWSIKRQYNGWRPIEAIRYMGERGQCSDTNQPSYNPDGLPLVPGLIEVVTTNTSQPGQRHFGLPAGAIAVYAWGGQPADPKTTAGGVTWILAANWMPYQNANFVTPSFPGFISGHSCFSRAGAEILTAFTGSPFFPGGLGTYTAETNSLNFEIGPSAMVQLQWGTYFDASDESGISRLWGGIHVTEDDLNGRIIGSECGKSAWALAQKYFDGSILAVPVSLSITQTGTNCLMSYNASRGFFYKLQSTTDLALPYTDLASGFTQALDSSIYQSINQAPGCEFFRIVRSSQP